MASFKCILCIFKIQNIAFVFKYILMYLCTSLSAVNKSKVHKRMQCTHSHTVGLFMRELISLWHLHNSWWWFGVKDMISIFQHKRFHTKQLWTPQTTYFSNLDNRAFHDFQNAENTESMEFSVKKEFQTGWLKWCLVILNHKKDKCLHMLQTCQNNILF